jgi:hypothetical protein
MDEAVSSSIADDQHKRQRKDIALSQSTSCAHQEPNAHETVIRVITFFPSFLLTFVCHLQFYQIHGVIDLNNSESTYLDLETVRKQLDDIYPNIHRSECNFYSDNDTYEMIYYYDSCENHILCISDSGYFRLGYFTDNDMEKIFHHLQKLKLIIDNIIFNRNAIII